jgi:hypothetical protein
VLRKFSVALLIGVAALLSISGVAQAAAPTNVVVSQTNRYLKASWTLPAGMATGAIEASTSPATDAYGFFFVPVLYAELASTVTSYEAPAQLPAGSYYVHVADYDPAAPTCVDPYAVECIWEFSTPLWKVVIPADPPPPPPPPPPAPPPPPDTITSFSALSIRASQKVDKLQVQASMGEAGTISVAGTVSVPKLSKVYKFKTVTATAVAGATVTLKLKLPAKAAKAVKKALKKHKKLKAKITITATDAAGNKKTELRTIKLQR